MDFETPSSVMYGCMKQFGSVKKGDLAAIVFSEDYKSGGIPITERLSERTFVTRQVVNASPGDFTERAFSDFPTSAQKVCAAVLSKYPGQAGKTRVIEYFAGEACDLMCESLQAYGLNDVLYRNITSRIYQMPLANDADKATLLILQFIVTGCLGDPARAADIVQEFSRQIVNTSFKTDIAQDGMQSEVPVDTSSVRLGLCRVIGGKLRMPAYEVDAGEEGTEIGSLATSTHAINDVEVSVSRRHLRVYRGEDAQWLAIGLGSTNGTTVVRRDSGQADTVEPPRAWRPDGYVPEPVPLYPGDMLCLGDDTQFMVLDLA